MATVEDIPDRLFDLALLRTAVCRRELSSEERGQLVSRLVAANSWLAGLTREEVDASLEREIRSKAARVWFRRQFWEGEDSLVACARREASLLAGGVSPTGGEIAGIVGRSKRSLERLLREYDKRRGRSISKWSPGFGEVSTSLAIRGNENLVHEHTGGVWGTRVYKRMPTFPDRAAAERYREVYFEYDRLLREEVGLELPPSGVKLLERGKGEILVFVWQLQLEANTIGPVVLRGLGEKEAIILLDLVLDHFNLLFEANRRLSAKRLRVGLDGQITNWAVPSYKAGGILGPRTRLVFLDTNTPLIRSNGSEVLDTEIFLRPLSPVLRPVVRRFFLQKILDRYYDPRTIILDFLGNTVVQGRSDLVGSFVQRVEERRSGDLQAFGISSISVEDVRRYVREDVFTWRLVRTARALHEAASAAASAEPSAAWARLRQVKRIWTSALFDVRSEGTQPSHADALD